MGKRSRRCVEQLTLYVRHRAWLEAAPSKGKDGKSRVETFTAEEAEGTDRTELAMPPIDEASQPFYYLIEHLFRVGPSSAGEVLSFREIEAWAGFNGYDLSGWEAETIRSLSAAYMSEHQQADDPKRVPPYSPAEPVIDRSEVSRRIMEAFRQLVGAPDDEVSPEASEDQPVPGRSAPRSRGRVSPNRGQSRRSPPE